MTYDDFLNQVIDGGIKGLKQRFPPEKDVPDGHNRQYREGGSEGFEACRGKRPPELLQLLRRAEETTRKARDGSSINKMYWWHRYYQLEVEWVCNCVSACLVNQNCLPILTPTAGGFARLAAITGGEEVVV